MHGLASMIETLQQNIDSEHGGSPTRYAESNNVAKQQVNEWLRHGGYYMHDNKLFLLRKDFNKQAE